MSQADFEELFSRIDAELKSGNPISALVLIEENRSKMPKNIKLLIRESYCQRELGNKELATSMLRDLVKRFPNNPRAAIQLINWCIEDGDAESVRYLIDDWRDRLPYDTRFYKFKIRQLRASIKQLRASGDVVRAWEDCEELIRLDSKLESVWIERLLMTESGALSQRWYEAAEQAAAAFPGSTRVLTAINIGATHRGEPSIMAKIAPIISESGMDSPKGYRMAAKFQYDQVNYPGALQLVEAGLEEYPDDFTLLFARLEVSREYRLSNAVLAKYAKEVIEHKGIEPRAVQVAMRILLRAGEDELAWKLLQKIVLNDSQDSGVRKLAKNFLKTGITQKKRADIDSGIILFDGDVVMRFPAAVRHVVFIFLGLGPVRMALLEPVLECLSKLGLGSVVLYDRHRYLYLKGLSCFGEDYESTIRALRELLPDSVQTVSCLGTSGGGYAALHYALDLEASSALVFGSPTNFVPEEWFREDTRAKSVGKRIVAAVPHMCVNLADTYERARRRPKVHMWYGDGFQPDRDQALNMQGVPGVTLHAVPDYELHHVMAYLDTIGKLEDVVRQAFIDLA